MGPHTAEEWLAICTQQHAQIERLCAELEEANQYVIWHREALAEGLVHLREADRLRAENAELRASLFLLMEQPTMNPLNMTPTQRHDLWSAHAKANAILARTAKEGE